MGDEEEEEEEDKGWAGIQNSSLISIVNPATRGEDGARRRNTVNYFRLRENVSPLNILSLFLSLSLSANFLRIPKNTPRLDKKNHLQPPLPSQLCLYVTKNYPN